MKRKMPKDGTSANSVSPDVSMAEEIASVVIHECGMEEKPAACERTPYRHTAKYKMVLPGGEDEGGTFSSTES